MGFVERCVLLPEFGGLSRRRAASRPLGPASGASQHARRPSRPPPIWHRAGPPDAARNGNRVFASSGTDGVYETSWRARSEDVVASSTWLFFDRDALRLTRSLREAVMCCTLWLSAPPRSNYSMFSVTCFCLAGAGGFEPPHGGIKIPCLTTWRRPNRRSGKRRGWPRADFLWHRRSIEGVEPFQQAIARIRVESGLRFIAR